MNVATSQTNDPIPSTSNVQMTPAASASNNEIDQLSKDGSGQRVEAMDSSAQDNKRKRSPDSIVSCTSDDHNLADITEENTMKKPTTVAPKNNKKRRNRAKSFCTLESVSLQLEPAKKFFADPAQQNLLNSEQTTNFLVETYRHKNPQKIAEKYTKDLEALSEFLVSLQNEINDDKLCKRIGKLANALKGKEVSFTQTEESSAAEDERENGC
ncbi:hypothetical protein QAD02_006936 [Eretmocerus hayati]|uniref:Uncharacterized protein n=1 Tax=Eretmocerus hayati TaxID=131215 RepID=A0ACC2N277_9HYME|nr:hypothetical protein QAD02_006936 [Eretmocerus hayati]